MREIKSYNLKELCNENEAIILKTGDGISIHIEKMISGTAITVMTGGEFIELSKGYSHLVLNKETEEKIEKEYKTVNKYLRTINKILKTR